ncbi:AraC family transcriptional regulator [Nonomuraea sp. NPDC050536]|uniref:AraC family transcriptional regulator n=1 Tax=Nonomuraea sp. NPDC050536 TaxID=3364366 RepID=UPI0037C82113
MDTLSEVIAITRTGKPRSARVEWRAPWGQRFGAAPGSMGFQVVLQGSCWLIPGEGEPIQLGVGDVVFFPHGDEVALADSPSTPLPAPACDPLQDHELFTTASMAGTGPVTVTLCGGYRLDRARIHPILTGLPGLIHLPARLGHHPELRAAIELLAAEIENPRLGADTVVSSLLDTLLLYILRAYIEQGPEPCDAHGWAAALADDAISAALDAMHREPAHPWTVESLGARAGLSRAAFARRFSSLIGQPPLSYLTWWRLAMAGRLLCESDAPLGEIAARVGYGSEFAFANAFKREYGTAPGRYRRASSPAVDPHLHVLARAF